MADRHPASKGHSNGFGSGWKLGGACVRRAEEETGAGDKILTSC